MAKIVITGTAGSDIISDPHYYRSAESTFAFFGDFGGGTLSVEASYNVDDSPDIFIPLKRLDGTLFEVTENEIHSITLGKCMIRYRISGATTDPNITVAIRD